MVQTLWKKFHFLKCQTYIYYMYLPREMKAYINAKTYIQMLTLIFNSQKLREKMSNNMLILIFYLYNGIRTELMIHATWVNLKILILSEKCKQKDHIMHKGSINK